MRISLPNSVIKERKHVRHAHIPTDTQALEICKAFSMVLDLLYPGYLWQVGMQQDMVYIQNMSLNKELAWKLPLAEFDIDGKVLMRIGGEILERHNLPRGKRVESKVKELPRDIRHNTFPEL